MSIFLQPETSFVAGPFLGIRLWNGGGGKIYKQKPYCTECGKMLGDKMFGVVSYTAKNPFLISRKKNLFQELFS